MSLSVRALAIGLAAIGALHSPSLAAEPDGVASMLDQQKIKYEVDKDKDYKIIYEFEDKRTQIVYVSGATEELDGMKIRSIFAPAARLKQAPLDGKYQSLLEYNGKSKIGSWEVSGDVLYFSARIVEPFSAAELESLLGLISSVADEKEKEISGAKDEL